MPDAPLEKMISSKEVLHITGISRATLNNYIKMGILPRPLVQRPQNGRGGTKQIGYFPVEVLDRLEAVKRLKREGRSMEDIQRHFMGAEAAEGPHEGSGAGLPAGPDTARPREQTVPAVDEGIKLTLPEISFPSYLVNYDFEILWMNHEAELKIFRQPVGAMGDRASARNIFKLFFNWELQRFIRNWKDLITFHMAFAKTKFAKTWIEKLYWGISESEVSVLEAAYDRVSNLPGMGIQTTKINLLKGDGTTEFYRVNSLFFKEGILFVYAPGDQYYHWKRGQ